MGTRTRRWVLGTAALAVVAIVAAAAVVLWGPAPVAGDGDPDAGAPAGAGVVASDFLAAFARGAPAEAAVYTDAPDEAAAGLTAAIAGLADATLRAELAPLPDVPADGDRVRGTATLTWTLGAGRTWRYETAVEVRRHDGGWAVHWTPALVHPRLGEGQRLEVRSATGPAVLDGAGRPLLVWRGGAAVRAPDAPRSILLPGLARVAVERAGGAWSVVAAGADGAAARLYGSPATDAEPLRSTLDLDVQRAARAAVDGTGLPAHLVALRPSDGAVLAVAQNAAAGAAPHALTGLYPPGSTFKIATATAVLHRGLAAPDTVLPCPGTARLGTRTIPNDGEFDLGSVPLRTAFAESCNTTFARLATRLPADGLQQAATRLGLNADFTIPGATTEAGTVTAAPDPVQRLEDAIGQGRVLASPFGVALMAATVAEGAAVTPRLWRDLPTGVGTGYEPPPAPVLGQVRAMMRQVVTGGTGAALAGRGAVYGKTGTAQAAEAETHGWFAGFRDDLAFAVLVRGAGTSGPAVTATADFLDRLP
ncbi:MecA-like transpeptidase family protein [Prauserella shujinwangii]|uniref:MecA-like transpeptidase family protein n=1 Tax=Prauserella shujinwangii TaxID=1453103 RepID=A0A2T0LS50_9PSEU|nr:penicillin-binding transpeptidase domain-containing protein [Prauserella shujinwangii]PRX46497.1 MecA-like transpeptidase family protein [Prauserella shujinwangii]